MLSESSEATEEIGRKINAIQADSSGAVEAIGQISAIITQINDIQNTIASAVEEQTATTNEIGRNITEAAQGSADIAQNISRVAQSAQETSMGAGETQKVSGELPLLSRELEKLVNGSVVTLH